MRRPTISALLGVNLVRCIYRKFTPGYPEDARTLRGLAFILRCVPSDRILRCVPSGRVVVRCGSSSHHHRCSRNLRTIMRASMHCAQRFPPWVLIARRLEPKKESLSLFSAGENLQSDAELGGAPPSAFTLYIILPKQPCEISYRRCDRMRYHIAKAAV